MTEPSRPVVSRLSTTAIKGLHLVVQDEVRLTPTGAEGDRQFFLMSRKGALLSITRTGAWAGHTAAYRPSDGTLTVTCPDGSAVVDVVRLGRPVTADFSGYKDVSGHEVEGPWSELFSEAAGQPVRLVRADRPNGGVDVRPATLLGEGSVRELARRAGLASVDARRFRMLIGLSGTAAHEEDTWEGRSLAVGDALLRVEGPVKRCGAVLRNPDDGESDLRTLRYIKDYRGLSETILGRGVAFGVYAAVERPGRVRVGDEVVLDAS